MGILVYLIVRMLDPITIALAVVGGVISRAWWHVAVVAVVVGVLIEIFLATATVLVRPFNPLVLILGIVGAGVWSALAFYIKNRWPRRKPFSEATGYPAPKVLLLVFARF
jgi:hypothetical protein